MRPEILNPIFAEIAALKGVGPALARPLKRLELERVADVLFHLPVTRIDRQTVAELDAGDDEIGRAHVCTPVTNAHLVCRLLLAKKTSRLIITDNSKTYITFN